MNESDLKAEFDRFDEDGNGAIDYLEFCHLMDVLDPGMDEDALKLGFELIDINGSGTIQFSEFTAWWNDDE